MSFVPNELRAMNAERKSVAMNGLMVKVLVQQAVHRTRVLVQREIISLSNYLTSIAL
jgi:hypothetical protein